MTRMEDAHIRAIVRIFLHEHGSQPREWRNVVKAKELGFSMGHGTRHYDIVLFFDSLITY